MKPDTKDIRIAGPGPPVPAPASRAAPAAASPAPEAVVVVPGGVNYFYDQAGLRLVDGLAALGCRAAVHTLRTVPEGEFDFCFLVNLYELGIGYGRPDAAVERVQRLRRGCRHAFAVAMDCAKTHWFSQTVDLCRRTGVPALLDLGFVDQLSDLARDARPLYRFAFNGLTPAERDALAALQPAAEDRPIPWVFVGHVSASRAELADRLVREVDPAGFVYLPRLVPVTEDGPHLNDEQFRRVLSRARYQVWRSHHEHFYMESERFRTSALAGCVPVKVIRPWEAADPHLPFRRRLVDPWHLGPGVRDADFAETWAEFRDEFLAAPTIEQGLAQIMSDVPAATRSVGRTTSSPRPAPVNAAPRRSDTPVPHHALARRPAGVTIAIPNWNHEFVLPRAIEAGLRAARSLRRRGVASEVLIVDDGSRDGSLTLLRQLEALYYTDGLRVLALAENVGLPAVRNLLLARASHPFIAFMDADNELVPDNLYHFARAMAQTGAAAVYGNLVRRGSGSSYTMVSNESFQDRVFAENYVDAFALFDRVQVLDVGGYSRSERVRAREDWELYLHLAAAGRRVVFVPLVFGTYHAMEGSMIEDANDTHSAQKAHVRRVFDQLGIRDRLPLKTRHLRYHPDLGYL